MKTIPKLFFLGVASVTFLAGTVFLLITALYRCLLFLASSLRNVVGKAGLALRVLTTLLVLSPAAVFATDAKALYEKACAKCHGSDGKGETKMGKKLGAKDYTDPTVQAALTDEAAFKATKEGLNDKEGKVLMKPAEGTTDDDIRALVAYMRTFKK
jgi:cytochrome c553